MANEPEWKNLGPMMAINCGTQEGLGNNPRTYDADATAGVDGQSFDTPSGP